MDENFLTEGTFQSSMDEIMEKRFGGKYTLEDVGEMVEFTEMTLEERMNIVATEITNDFAELSKSLDDIQKSLYNMFGMLVDSQADLTKSSENGGITDADVKKIVDGLQLEEKFFPHLYQYLDERFGLDAEKIKNFRERTASVIGASEDEGEEREGRTQSTADINKRTDMNPSKKSTTVGRRAFEDQNVFNNRLRLWTEGHKEPSSQKSDDKSKKDKSDDESLISKIIKVGMIAGMIMEILAKSPTITEFFSSKIKGLWDELNKEGGVIDKIKGGLWSGFVSLWDETIQPWLSEKFQLGKEWFKENFPELYNTLSYITQLVLGAYYANMSTEQQELYAKAHPESDLNIWREATNNSGLGYQDIFQFATLTSGNTGEYLKDLSSRGKLKGSNLGENFTDQLSGESLSGNFFNDAFMRYSNMEEADFITWIGLVKDQIPDSEDSFMLSAEFRRNSNLYPKQTELFNKLKLFGLQRVDEGSFWDNYSGLKSALSKYYDAKISESRSYDAAVIQNAQKRFESRHQDPNYAKSKDKTTREIEEDIIMSLPKDEVTDAERAAMLRYAATTDKTDPNYQKLTTGSAEVPSSKVEMLMIEHKVIESRTPAKDTPGFGS